jgi:hypothetical protein
MLHRIRPPRDEARLEWIRLHEGHTEAALLTAHARNVLELNHAMRGSLRDLTAAVDFYIDQTETREELRHAIEVIALDLAYRDRAASVTRHIVAAPESATAQQSVAAAKPVAAANPVVAPQSVVAPQPVAAPGNRPLSAPVPGLSATALPALLPRTIPDRVAAAG